MTTKENAPKAEKAVILDSSIMKDYRFMVKNSLESHWGFITNTNSKMVEGIASVRIVKASINEASKDGQDSIIKASQVEGFGIALQLRKLSGTDKQPIATVLKASMRAKRLEGVEAVQQLLEGIKTWEGFIARLESAEEVKAEATEEAEAEEADKAKEIDLTSITWEAMVEILIKKAKGGDMRADTIDPKLGGQGIAILHQLVKNAKATQKVNA